MTGQLPLGQLPLGHLPWGQLPWRQLPWGQLGETDPNVLWDIIYFKICKHLDIMCPLKYLRVSTKKPFWLSHHIIELINDRNKMYKIAISIPNKENLTKARSARNRVNKSINTSKQDFVKETLDLNKADPKKFWRIINSTLLKANSQQSQTNLLSDDGSSLSYEDYLTGFGMTLTDQFSCTPIQPDSPSFNSYGRQRLNHSYTLTEDDILKIVNDIEISKGSGIDFLPSFILKDAFKCIVSQVTHMMNQSLITSIFPTAWAIASVTPIPKTGNLLSVKNWRPISILPLPGKLLEKMCTKLLLEELCENDILIDVQYGFRTGLSTSHAIQHYVKYIIDGINNKKVTAGVYLDFARAFDSVNYDILILKLRDMGISNMIVNWISGYLGNRQMCTKFNSYTSNTKSLICGVPQGSVVGPILFLCYVNDIIDVCSDASVKIVLYADDTVIFCRSDNVLELQDKMQNTLHNVSTWCENNRINLNVKKTKPCCYGTRHLLNGCHLNFSINNSPLLPCTQYKYLGVFLDETLNMEANLNYIFKQLSYKIFQFSKIRNYLDIKTRVLVYKQTVMPLAEYASFMLNLNRKHDIEKLQKLQNRALRLCFNVYSPRDVSVAALHTRANLDLLSTRREMQLLGLMYDISDNQLYVLMPRANTRQADKIVFSTEIVKYDIYQRSPYYVGCNLWNTLPVIVQKQQTRDKFKTEVKRFLRNRNV